MDSTDKERFRSRPIEPEARAERVQILLNALAASERKTDPTLGADSANGKDHEALRALHMAGKLVDAVAGWALDHVCGLSVASNSWQLQGHESSFTTQHHEYQESRASADDHLHELVGRLARDTNANFTDEERRALLRNLLFANSGGFPLWLRIESVEALDAIAFGETTPLFDPPTKHSHVRLRELRAQLELVSIARFRAAAYGRVAKQLEFVAAEAGVSAVTLRNWEYRLRKALGRLEVDRAIEDAKLGGSYVKAAADRLSKGLSLHQEERELSDLNEQIYGADGLAKAVSRYKRVQTSS